MAEGDRLRQTTVGGVSGLVFGIGLILSGMTDPARVLGFLDVAGQWNPALAFVMAGAVAVAAPAFAFARHRGRSLLGRPIVLPDRFRIDAQLVAGAAIFGIGWSLTGICPGPAILILTTLRPEALLFGAGLVVGMVVSNRWLAARPQAANGTGASPSIIV
ncbi:MAG TPA: DUF6691 family protein [Stellaceae bacterium]|nr:DUF6691 family protein [Stellaceae bacterium]